MTNFAQEMFDDLKEYFPDIAEEVVSYYRMTDHQLCVNMRDNGKIVYDIYHKTLRIFSPVQKPLDVLEDEEKWRYCFTKNLRQKIEESGYTYTQIAAKTGIHRNTLSQYVCRTQTPPAANLAKIARVLGYPIECFFAFQDENE